MQVIYYVDSRYESEIKVVTRGWGALGSVVG
jgi:hypothetical protein